MERTIVDKILVIFVFVAVLFGGIKDLSANANTIPAQAAGCDRPGSNLKPDQSYGFESDISILAEDSSGHWKSGNTASSPRAIYLDLNICEDGRFSGIFSAYLCILMNGPITSYWYCSLQGGISTPPVSGKLDFSQNNGIISLEDCKDVPVTISEKTEDQLILLIHTSDICEGFDYDISSRLHYEGSLEGACDSEDPNDDNTPSGDSDSKNSGGCFLNSLLFPEP